MTVSNQHGVNRHADEEIGSQLNSPQPTGGPPEAAAGGAAVRRLVTQHPQPAMRH